MHAFRIAVALSLLVGCSKDVKQDAGAGERAAAPSGAAAESTIARPRGICGYITEAEASRALDQPSKYRNADGTGQSCTLDPASGDAFHGVSVDFKVSRGNADVYDFFAAQQAAEPLGGLGDRALWLPAGETRGNLVVVQGPYAVSLTISDFSGKGNLKGRARAFAERVLDRL
ncbi:MAG TPA: hypothetical protein VH833_03485 [Gemmatimonadales bacterium]|jgi:hypothetical protein